MKNGEWNRNAIHLIKVIYKTEEKNPKIYQNRDIFYGQDRPCHSCLGQPKMQNLISKFKSGWSWVLQNKILRLHSD